MDKSNNSELLDIVKYDDALGLFERIPRIKSPTGEDDEQMPLCPKAVEKVGFKVADLFPAFTNTPVNDNMLGDYELEQYGYYRSLGLSIADTAYSLHLSAANLTSLLSGEGLSLEKFVELIKQELFARAKLRARLLRDIEQSSGTKNWKTSLTLLEKLYPEEFGPRSGQTTQEPETTHVWDINIVDPKVPAVEEKE